jgi:hypothetical protein
VNKDFIIEVEIKLDHETVIATIDLAQPEFETAVLAAAGRFRSLKRTRRGGGRPRIYIQCHHGRKVWKNGGKKCEKCRVEKANEEKRSKSPDGTEKAGNGPSRHRMGVEAGVSKGEPGQENKHEDNS